VVMGIKEDSRRNGTAIGRPFPKRPFSCKLSAHAWKKIEDLFHVMDMDGSNAVTRKEAQAFFKGQFTSISATAMFNEVDVDKSGAITADEFIAFWLQVRAAGYKEQEIVHEIDEIMAGSSWVDWMDGRSTCHAPVKPFPKRPFLCRLSSATWKKCESLFHKIDADRSQTITHEEAVNFFKCVFSNVSADEMCNRLDVNNHGAVTAEEFMDFWLQVRAAGYKERTIVDEIDALMNGEAWVDWTFSSTSRAPRSESSHSSGVQFVRFPKRPLFCRLSARVWRRCEELFHKMDVDGFHVITYEKALHFFKGTFNHLSAEEMFNRIDVNRTETITAEDFMAFWVQVKAGGHKDSDILHEIDQLMEGAAWVDWNDLPDTGHWGSQYRKQFPKRPFLCKLSAHTWHKCEELFNKIAADGSLEITRERAERFFSGAFGKLSADEMFAQVAVTHQDTITAEDFMTFWINVKNSGYKEKDMLDEIEDLLQGMTWVDWKHQRFPSCSSTSRLS